ncbi:MAG: Cullin-domain-containing protein [Monoraphidium minutum]|nr:MAG: Cullin-domain-containing protein [Monoraphidium minutum]
MATMTTNGKARGAAGAKKLVIKPLKQQPRLPANFEQDTWAKLEDAVDAVHCKRAVACSLEELYRAVEDMCTHKMQDSLYRRLQAACDAHISRAMATLQEQVALDPVAFLDRADGVWQDYCAQMLTVRCIFLYLDRTFVIGLPGLRSIFDMGLQLLRSHLERNPQVEARIVRGLLLLVERERHGEAVDRQLLASLLRMLKDLGLYGPRFEAPFLSETAAFYRSEAAGKVAECGTAAYLAHCEARLTQEHERAQHYLDAATRRPLVAEAEAQLVAAHLPALLAQSSFAALVDAQREDDLGRLFDLAARVNGLEALRAAWREYIQAAGGAIVRDEEKDKDMVDRLLALKGRLEAVLAGSFGGAPAFSATLRDALSFALNTRKDKPAELVAKFIDARLRAGGGKGLSEGELEEALDAALGLFRLINGKDTFEAFYKKDLAKRLLLGKSASLDAEKLMVAKLKAECGQNFTQGIEGMFTDMEVSKEQLKQFRVSHMSSGPPPVGAPDDAAPAGAAPGGGAGADSGGGASSSGGGGIEFLPQVLTQQFWPTYTPLELNLPAELADLQQRFLRFYNAKAGGGGHRRLVWQHSLSTCLLRAAYPKGAKELSVSLAQSVILCLFNGADALAYSEVKELSGMGADEKELRRNLMSLCVGKVRLLKKSSKGPEVGDADVFSFNGEFSDPRYRIKVNTIQLKETQEEAQKTQEQVLVDRQHAIDAAVVRIMKTRKSLAHKLLVAEVLGQLKFSLTSSDLKRRIENLIEREFLERDPSDPTLYKYLA